MIDYFSILYLIIFLFIILSTILIQMLGTIFSIICLLVLLFVLYVVYEFVIKLNMSVSRFKKMDPAIRIFTSPFTGLLGVQKNCI
jgi:hypothetical protein